MERSGPSFTVKIDQVILRLTISEQGSKFVSNVCHFQHLVAGDIQDR